MIEISVCDEQSEKKLVRNIIRVKVKNWEVD